MLIDYFEKWAEEGRGGQRRAGEGRGGQRSREEDRELGNSYEKS